jgi:RNA polymerase sigma-70 factor (ECF subfamily)
MHSRPTSTTDVQRKEDFLALMLPLRDRLAHYARGVCRSAEEAEDLVSDTILAALEGFDRIRDRSHFRGFVFRIASRLHRRRRFRARLFGALSPEREDEIVSSTTSPDIAADVMALRRALLKLPPEQREAVVLFEIVGLSLEEVRHVQNVSIPAVKSRVSRGRRRLAEILGVSAGVGRRRGVIIVADLPDRSVDASPTISSIHDGRQITSAR